jgi:ferredoxin-type protein NapH
MTLYQCKHFLIQVARYGSRLAVMLLVVGLVYLSLYAHYRAARALEDEQYLQGVRGAVLVAIDQRVKTLQDPQSFLDGYKGTLWSMLVGGVNLTDPLAAVEMTATSKTFYAPLWLSILIPVAFTLLLGRVFCSWMCPAGLLFELTDKLRRLLRLAEIEPGEVRFAHQNKYIGLLVGLLIAGVVGLPIFALVYPPAVVSRLAHAVIFGTALTGMLVLLGGIVVFELAVSPRWWCRTMCPGGALYGLLGWSRLLRVKLKGKLCTACRECEPVCPMGLDPVRESASIECDNCLVCLRHCPEAALYVGLGLPPSIRRRRRRRARVAARKTPVVATLLLSVLLWPQFGMAHHILGIPHYAYKENYPQVPTLEYPATVGSYDILMTSYPGKPKPGEPANLAFYIKNRQTGVPYARPVTVRVLQPRIFASDRILQAATSIEPFDKTHKLSVTFPDDGKFLVELSLTGGSHPEVVPFIMVVGEPPSTVRALLVLTVILVLGCIVIRAILIKRRRRARGARSPGSHTRTLSGTAG